MKSGRGASCAVSGSHGGLSPAPCQRLAVADGGPADPRLREQVPIGVRARRGVGRVPHGTQLLSLMMLRKNTG
jgi:hypothetical protein